MTEGPDIQSKAKPLIVFDLISNLLDAGGRYAEAYIRMCRAWNIEPPKKEDILSALGNKNLKQIIAEYTPDIPESSIEGFMRDCNMACDTLLYSVDWHEDLYPHVREVLAGLGQEYVLGIFTGSREDIIAAQLRYHNIQSFFDGRFIHGKDNERDGALASDILKARQLNKILLAYAQLYGMDKTKARSAITVVGDSVADSNAARKAGMNFIGFAPTDAGRRKFQAKDTRIKLFSDFLQLSALLGATAMRAEPKLQVLRL